MNTDFNLKELGRSLDDPQEFAELVRRVVTNFSEDQSRRLVRLFLAMQDEAYTHAEKPVSGQPYAAREFIKKHKPEFLLALQQDPSLGVWFTSKQVKRHVDEILGVKDSTARTVGHILRDMILDGTVERRDTSGIYTYRLAT